MVMLFPAPKGLPVFFLRQKWALYSLSGQGNADHSPSFPIIPRAPIFSARSHSFPAFFHHFVHAPFPMKSIPAGKTRKRFSAVWRRSGGGECTCWERARFSRVDLHLAHGPLALGLWVGGSFDLPGSAHQVHHAVHHVGVAGGSGSSQGAWVLFPLRTPTTRALAPTTHPAQYSWDTHVGLRRRASPPFPCRVDDRTDCPVAGAPDDDPFRDFRMAQPQPRASQPAPSKRRPSSARTTPVLKRQPSLNSIAAVFWGTVVCWAKTAHSLEDQAHSRDRRGGL